MHGCGLKCILHEYSPANHLVCLLSLGNPAKLYEKYIVGAECFKDDFFHAFGANL